MSKLSNHLFTVLEERIAEVKAAGIDFDSTYLTIVSKENRIVKTDDDMSLGLALGILLGEQFSLTDGLEFKFLANVEYGKLYTLDINYPEALLRQVESDLGL